MSGCLPWFGTIAGAVSACCLLLAACCLGLGLLPTAGCFGFSSRSLLAAFRFGLCFCLLPAAEQDNPSVPVITIAAW